MLTFERKGVEGWDHRRAVALYRTFHAPQVPPLYDAPFGHEVKKIDFEGEGGGVEIWDQRHS